MPTSIARYLKLFLGQVDIDVTVFSAHSTRSASTSKGNNLGLTLDDIHKAGGWKEIALSESTINFQYIKMWETIKLTIKFKL